MAGELTTLGARVALDYIAGKALDLGTATFTTYLALCTATIGDDTLMTALPEVTTTGYARTAITWGSATTANPPVISNSALVTFPAVTVDMTQPIVSAALVSSASGPSGNYLMWWGVSPTLLLLTGQQLQISIGALSMSLT